MESIKEKLDKIDKLLEEANVELAFVADDVNDDELNRIQTVLEDTHNELDSWIQNND